jgi:arylformamidase
MTIELFGRNFSLDKGIDLSIAISEDGPRAWYVNVAQIVPVMNDQFIGSTDAGGAVNFRNVFFNPHGHGTHTENYGHISSDAPPVIESVSRPFWLAQLVTVDLEELSGDLVVNHIPAVERNTEALIIRTKPNDYSKKTKNYSGTNFPYVSLMAMQQIVDSGIKHLLIDLPSVDREEDGGKLAAHHLFWNVPKKPDVSKTITELIFVPDSIPDGIYALNLQVSNFRNDAAPSRPLIFVGKEDKE